MIKSILYSLLLLSSLSIFAQTQVVKGTVSDAQARYPIIGATITVIGTDPLIGAVTDIDGKFRIENAPIGRVSLHVKYVGYQPNVIPNIIVTSGKEIVLSILLEESVEELDAVVISNSEGGKASAINEFSMLSSKTFDMEDVRRFSGGQNDPSKLVTSFAGVSNTNDARNDIIVRGNSPVGLLWKVEGISMPTTSHFSTLGTTGGPVNALNTNMLRNSDFITSAFPAEYGNGYSAVFDINFRSGNMDKLEGTAEMTARTGMEFMLEGPIKKSKSSFLASYRYGIASLVLKDAPPFYQDFAFKLNLGKTKLGRFEIFGMYGKSNIDFLAEKTSENNLFSDPNIDAFTNSQIGLVGMHNTIQIGKNTFLRTTLGGSTNSNEYIQNNRILGSDNNLLKSYRSINSSVKERRYTFSSFLNSKLNSKWTLVAGILNEVYSLNLDTESRDKKPSIPDQNNDNIPDYFLSLWNLNTTFSIFQTYFQVKNKVTNKLNYTAGVHFQYHQFTKDYAIEPRVAMSWRYTPKTSLNIGYGLHSQAVPAPVLFLEENIGRGVYQRTNSNLKFIRAHHFVIGNSWAFHPNWNLKTELYYQQLYNIPVDSAKTSYSLLNDGANFTFSNRNNLTNNGTGSNYGMETTLEKFFSNQYYLFTTLSLFNSKYKGSDKIERNTAFNTNYIVNILAGKEWNILGDDAFILFFDTRFTFSGGRPYTPIDLASTRANNGIEKKYEDRAFSERYKPYLRWDVKLGFRMNKGKTSHRFYFDFLNVTDRTNDYRERYNTVTDKNYIVTQLGFFPDFGYIFNF